MQKQANIRAAISTLDQAKQATIQATETANLTKEMKKQAEETAKQTEAATKQTQETAKQGQIIMIFTIVTVIFVRIRHQFNFEYSDRRILKMCGLLTSIADTFIVHGCAVCTAYF